SLIAHSGGTIGLVGGNVRVEQGAGTGIVSAPSGNVALVATAGAGDVLLGTQLQPVGFASLGRVEILNGTLVSVAEGSGSAGSGHVLIRGGEIVVDHAKIDATTRRGAGGSIDIIADGNLGLHA